MESEACILTGEENKNYSEKNFLNAGRLLFVSSWTLCLAESLAVKHHDLSYSRLHVKSATYQPLQLNMNERGAIAITLLFLFALISALLYFARREVVLFASRVFGNSPSTDEESQAEQAVNKEGQERNQSGGEKKAEANPSCRFPENGRSRCT